MKTIRLLFLMAMVCGSTIAFAQEEKPLTSGHFFTTNEGQVKDVNGNPMPEIEYLYHANGMDMGLQDNGFTYNLVSVVEEVAPFDESTGQQQEERSDEPQTIKHHRVDVTFLGANDDVELQPSGAQKQVSHYYLPESQNGIIQVHHYQTITYKNLYDHIDIVLTAKQDANGQPQIKYDIIVHPGGKLSQVKMQYEGMFGLRLEDERLHISTSIGDMTEEIPVSYLASSHEEVEVRYAIEGNVIQFDTKVDGIGKTLVIDPTIAWSTFIGGNQNDFAEGMTVDAQGNIYTIGDARSSSFPVTSGAFQTAYGGGTTDATLTKLSADQQLLWSTWIGGSGTDEGLKVAVDDTGNVFVTGLTNSSDFPVTNGAFQSTFAGGSDDAFVAKFRNDGTMVWNTYFGGSSNDISTGLKVDRNNDIVLGGYTRSSDFPISVGAYQASFAGAQDVFVTKFSSGGGIKWSTFIGGTSFDQANDLAVDTNNTIYIAGSCGTGYPTTAGTYQPSHAGGSWDVMASKISSSGNLIWGTYIGSTSSEYGYAVAADDSGNVFVGGIGPAAFPTTPGAFQPTAGNRDDAILVKFSSSGQLRWSTFLQGNNDDRIFGLATDDNTNLWVTGETRSTDFPVTGDAYQATHNGSWDGFVSQFSGQGSYLYGSYLGGSSAEEATSIVTVGSCAIYVAGHTRSNDFPTLDGYQNTKNGLYDQFVTHFTKTTYDTISPVACDTYLSPSSKYTWTNSGTYQDTLLNAVGCDSVITINLTVLYSTTATIAPTVCDSYTSPSGKVWTTGNIYQDTIPNAVGCDSIITIDLTVNYTTLATINPTACDNYVSPGGKLLTSSGTYQDTIPNTSGCDSLITINLTINNSTAATLSPQVCDSYTSPSGKVWTTSGNYLDTIPNAVGCDSVITIELDIQRTTDTIDPVACFNYTSPSGRDWKLSGTYFDTIPNSAGCDSIITINLTVNEVDTSITQSGFTLTSNAAQASYQWLDCEKGFAPIANATNQSFTPDTSGNYAVEVTENGCIDTSSCFAVIGVGIDQSRFADKLRVFPNPTNGRFTIDFGEHQQRVDLLVTDVTGRLVHSRHYHNTRIVQAAITAASGLYFLHVSNEEGGTATVKLMVE